MTTPRTFDAAFTARNMRVTRTTAKHTTHHLDQNHYLVTVPRQIGRWYGGAVASLSGLIVSGVWGYVTDDWLFFIIAGAPLAGAFVGCMASAIAADQGHRIWLEYATMGDMVEETAEPIQAEPEPLVESVPLVENTPRHMSVVQYKFNAKQIEWLASIAYEGDAFPIRDGGFKDSKVWSNVTATYPEVRDALNRAGVLDDNNIWTAAGVRWARMAREKISA